MPAELEELFPLAQCDDCIVRHKAICSVLSGEEILVLSQIVRRRTLRRGQSIMLEGQPTTFFANVISGVVKLNKTLPDGRQQIVGLLFPPDFLGRALRENNPYFAVAATTVELCCIPHASFETLLREFPKLEHKLFQQTLNELDAAHDWMILLGRKNAAEKVACLLLMLAKRSQSIGDALIEDGECPEFELPLTRADIGDYLGLSVETVSRQLSSLKSQGLIELEDNKLVRVSDIDALTLIAGQDAVAAC